MKSNELMFSKGSNDECFTPAYAVKPILEFIPKDKIIWCPFDTKDSEFVKQISEKNVVVSGHIQDGLNYYHYQPDDWDIIISNPPFTGKRQIFERALSFNKPFALLMSNTWLNDSTPIKLFMKRDLQLLMFDKRIRFITDGKDNSKITFSSSYYCWNLLPKQIIMREIKIEKQYIELDKSVEAMYDKYII